MEEKAPVLCLYSSHVCVTQFRASMFFFLPPNASFFHEYCPALDTAIQIHGRGIKKVPAMNFRELLDLITQNCLWSKF